MSEATAEKTPTASPEIFNRQFEAYRVTREGSRKPEPTNLEEMYEQKFNLLFGWRVWGFKGYGGFDFNKKENLPMQVPITTELVKGVIQARLDLLKQNKPKSINIDLQYEQTRAMHERALESIDGQRRETENLLEVTKILTSQAKAQKTVDSAGISPEMIHDRAAQVLKFVYDNKDLWAQERH